MLASSGGSSLGSEFAVQQASVLDGVPFDASTFGEDGGAADEVDVGGCQVVVYICAGK